MNRGELNSRSLFSNQRAQLTIFIIIGIVIVVGIILYFFMDNNFLNRDIEGSEAIRSSVEDCIDFTTRSSLYIVSYQGGFYKPPTKVFDFDPTFFPYYYFEGKSLMPEIEDIESEMGLFVEDYLGDCFDRMDSSGFDISYDVRDVRVTIEKNGVRFSVDSSVILRRDETTMKIELLKYPKFYETRLYDIIEVSRFYIQDQLEDPEMYCISCITRMCEENDLHFLIFPVLDDVDMIMAFEEGEDALVMNFMAKYRGNKS